MLLVMFYILLAASLHPQKGSDLPPAVPIQSSGARTLTFPYFAFFDQAKSDDNGNLFFHPGSPNYRDSTLVEVIPDRSQPVIFSLPSEFRTTTFFESFDVSPSGNVHVLAADSTNGTQFIFEFDADGTVRSKTELQVPHDVRLQTFSIFESSGHIFLSGYHGPDAKLPLKGKSFLAILDNSGRLIRLLNDPTVPDIKDMGDPQAPTTDEGATFLSKEGEIYFLNPRSILVVTESGRVRKKLTLTKPVGSVARKIVVSDRIIAVWLLTPTRGGNDLRLTLETLDANSGRVTGVYVPSEELGDVAVHYAKGEFIFLKPDGGKMELLTGRVH